VAQNKDLPLKCQLHTIRNKGKDRDMSRSTKSRGIGCFTVVGIVFIVLKLLEIQPVASWSWLWVLSPFWIALAFDLVLVLLGIFLIWLSHRRW
jgi:hypothetical protein